ncbi:MAG: RDD family protein [Bryobacteraceae bacterium]|jgi:uncharacterized RDD family membrane protein YckC
MRTKTLVLYDATQADRMKELSGVKLATFGSRAAALLIDFLLASLLFLAVMAVVILAAKYIPAVRNWDAAHDVHIELNFFDNWYSVAYLAMFFGLSLYWGHGRTLGKRFMKLRVISLHHDHLSLWTCIERALGYGASALEFGFGFVQYFIHPNRQTVHDRIAETIVVCEDHTRAAR